MNNPSMKALELQRGIEQYGRGLTTSGIDFHWGKSPATDGKTIFLPEMPNDADAKYICIQQASLFHEVGHIDFTDFDQMKRAKKFISNSKMFHSIWNGIEDAWMENAMCHRWNGGDLILSESLEFMFERGMVKDGSNPADIVPVYAYLIGSKLYRKWALLDQPLSAMRRKAVAKLGNVLIEKIEDTLFEVMPLLASTKDCLKLAEVIYKMLPPEEQSQLPSPGESKDFGSALDAAKSEAKAKAKAEAKAKAKEGQSKSEQSEKGEPSDAKDGSDSKGEGDKSSNDSKGEGAGMPDALGGIRMAPTPLIRQRLPNGMRLANALRPILLDERRHRKNDQKSGRIHGSRLWRVGVDDARIFRKNRYETDVLASVALLIDLSGSMDGKPIEEATLAAAEFASAMGMLKVPCGIFGFGSRTGSRLIVSKAIDTTPASDRVLGLRELVGGGTPTAEALEAVATQFNVPSRNKLVFVITDGAPGSVGAANTQVRRLKEKGIQPVMIMIDKHGLCSWAPDCPTTIIRDASALPVAMENMIKSLL